MRSIKQKSAAFQRPAKFNFLTARAPANGNAKMRRDWPVGLTPAEAKNRARASMRDLEKLQADVLRGKK